MNIPHPSENELQEYALDKQGCPATLAEHITSCEHCRAAVATYQFLFSGVEQQPRPAFDFNLPDLVIVRLPTAKAGLSPDRFIAGFLFVFICCCIGVPIWFFRVYLLNMFDGVSPFFIYAIAVSAILILSFKILTMYKKYQQQIRLLNFR